MISVEPLDGGVAATYSIVARDERSGQLGVAVQSHYFSVGPLVSWAEPGVGAVATQSVVEPAYGPRGLRPLRRGARRPTRCAAARGRRARGGAPGRDRRQARPRGGAHRRALHPRGGPPRGGRRLGAGQHDGAADRAGRDDRGLPRPPAASWPAACSRRSRRPSARAATSAAASRRRSSSWRRARAARPMQDRPVDLRVEDHPEPGRRAAPPGRRCGAPTSASRPATSWRRAGDLEGALARVRGARTPSSRTMPSSRSGTGWRSRRTGARPRRARAARAGLRASGRAGASCCGGCPRPGCSRMIQLCWIG